MLDKLRGQLEEFTAKEVVIPLGMRQIIAGRDSVMLDPALGVARLVVWVDSVACSPCRAGQMHLYSQAINYRKETKEMFIARYG